ncbi:hypothetical protein [Falsiroseomonas oryzae]|uniref:hypothetical protein n=1 Tax=Falsiroseomonas oryzae TaxID=2766473 RepID=UPI0022EA3BB3|nr:hypothetical protein [Roseomonas sp. MO-31]
MGPIVEARLVGGRLGNKMFQAMFAHMLARQVPGAVVTGDPLPEFGLVPPQHPLPARHLLLGGHRVDLPRVAYLLRHGLIGGVATSALGCRMEFLEPVETVRGLFPSPAPRPEGFGADWLVINIRAPFVREGGGGHPGYLPLPAAYYERLVGESGLRPVFLGQIGKDAYSEGLRARFPRAEFIPSRGAIPDFETIRASRHICVAVSTFSWLAAWLSEAETIHLPVAGIFHPALRTDINLLPLHDGRYRFQLLPARPWGGTPAELAEALEGIEAGREIAMEEALALLHPPREAARPAV